MRFTDWVYWTKTLEWWATATLTPEQELVKLALTSFVTKWFYESENDKIKRIQDASRNVSDEFALSLAIWARENWLRTVNQIILMEHLKSPLFEKAFDLLVKRPDEMLDMVWYYAMINDQHLERLKLSNKLKRAIKNKLEKFDEYQIAKYKSRWTKINLYDLVNISHAYSKVIDSLMKGKLETATTRESKLSMNGNNKESWDLLLSQQAILPLAFIRNIRNMMDSWVSLDNMTEYAKWLNFDKVFPYQVIQALWIACSCWLNESHSLFSILEEKIKQSMQKFKALLKGRVAIGIDTSWSMYVTMSNSKLQYIDMACYYGAYIAEMCDWDMYLRSDSCKKVEYKDQKITDIANLWYRCWTHLRSFIDNAKNYDTLFVITDEQVHDRNLSPSNATNKIIRNIQDYSNSIAELYWWTYITWLDDRLLMLSHDLKNIDAIIEKIKSIWLERLEKSK